MDRLKQIEIDFEKELKTVSSVSQIPKLKSDYLGKKGKLSGIMRELKELSNEERRELGQKSNLLKESFTTAIESRLRELEIAEINERLTREPCDVTLKESIWDRGLTGGGYHPITTVRREVEDIFLSMGFTILDGPYIEDEYHNFEALNIPETHPAREMQDTFWFKNMPRLLRTHTSPIQIRGMEKHAPPFRFVAPGKVFRSEATDASHEAVFHQCEGMYVDRGVSIAHLIHFLKSLLGEIFRKEIKIRLRPGYFPFVEPGFELDISCLICEGSGCSVCKQSGWVEFVGCGMVHPAVLEFGNIDPKEFSGFAFGLGLDRAVMMRYGINDIRLIHSGNLGFVSQFRSY